MRKIAWGITITTSFLLADFFGGALANVSGEAFLGTKGGSVITCAGNPVYIEKANRKGYAYLTDNLAAREQHLKYLKFKASQFIDKVAYWEKTFKNSSSDASKSFTKEQLIKAREERKKETAKERKARLGHGKELLIAQKEISNIKAQREKCIKENTKETICNSQGQFSFSELPLDDYYISTTVQWFVGDEKQGGVTSKTVTLKEGENKIFINQ